MTTFETFPQARETEAERNIRMADGRITEEEIQAHWENPDRPLFEHEIVRSRPEGAEKTKFAVRAITEELMQPLLEEIASAWEDSVEPIEQTLTSFFEQRKSVVKPLLNAEYYTAVDEKGHPFAMTGLYTVDIRGVAGFSTRDVLDKKNHTMAAGLGWFSVSERYQGKGIGGFLLDWTEKMASARGAGIMFVETDDWENEANAVKMYEKKGYKHGMNVKDFFGPDRNLCVYFMNIKGEEKLGTSGVEESLREENREDVLRLAERIYSPERFEEFSACIGLVLQQKPEEKSILKARSIVLRDSAGEVEGFAVFAPYYGNMYEVFWEGADPEKPGARERVLLEVKKVAKSSEREVIVLSREGEDEELPRLGFQSANNGVPEVFSKGDETRWLVYSKKIGSEVEEGV